MKLGLFDHMQKHDIPRRSYRDLYKSHLELVEMADQEWIFILSRSTISIWVFPSVRAPAVFSARLLNAPNGSVWDHWSMCCRSGIRSGLRKKSQWRNCIRR